MGIEMHGSESSRTQRETGSYPEHIQKSEHPAGLAA